MSHYRASLVAIGTEVTSGEILNSNAQWLAQELEKMGIEVLLHLAVPDEKELMLKALAFAAQHTEILVLVGGLGPTRDDLTREVVARWLKRPLEFLPEMERELVEKLKKRGVELRPSHRQQCEFPQGSIPLENTVGTARGFLLSWSKFGEEEESSTAPSQSSQWLVALPGPPRELKPMWEGPVMNELQALSLDPPYELIQWSCQGVPESEVAEFCEEILKTELEHPQPIQLGFRASPPFVHVKVWFPRARRSERPALEKLMAQKLADWLA